MSSKMENVLEDLGEKLFGGFSSKDGLSKSEINKLENNLSINLPIVLRNFYSLVGKHSVITKAHNQFLQLQDCHIYNDSFIFLEENQNVVFWGISKQDLYKDDPPVQQGNFEENNWYLDADFLSAFLLGISCWQSAIGMPWTGTANIKNNKLIEKLQKQLIYADPGVVDQTNDLVGFYEKNLVVAISKSAKILLIGAREQSSAKQFEDYFNIRLNYQ